MDCKICGNHNENTNYIVKENMFGLNVEFLYYQCKFCKCLQIDTIPDNIEKFYPDTYYSYNQVSNKRINNSLKRYFINERNSFKVLKKGTIGKLLNIFWPASSFMEVIGKIGLTKQSTILDVGSGNGDRLQPLIAIGLKIKGIEPFIKEPIYTNEGLLIEKKTIFEVDEKFDLIMFNHVFEHLHNPLETLEKVNNLLNLNGICLLRIPIVSSYAWTHYGINWVSLDAPRHYFLHSLKSVEILSKKANFRIKEIIFDSTEFQFMGSEFYKQGISLINGDFSFKDNKYFTEKQIKKYKSLAKELNKQKLGDQAAFFLVKD